MVTSRRWLSLSIQDETSESKKFTIMTYNILAQRLIKRQLFPYASKNSLKWKTRGAKLVAEIASLKPDIACLQEVDNFEKHFSRRFASMGYDKHHVFYDNEDLALPRLKTQNVAQLVALKLRDGHTYVDPFAEDVSPEYSLSQDISTGHSHGLIITNHHLYWEPSATYERLRQCWLLFQYLKRFNKPFNFPPIVCGDFNITPDSALYRVLTEGKTTSSDLSEYPEIENVPADENGTLLMTIQELLEGIVDDGKWESAYSAYSSIDPTYLSDKWLETGEPKFTNYAVWKGTLDYMFVRPKFLALRRLWSLPPERDLKPGLPNDNYASDHLCLMAEMEFKSYI